MLYKPTHKLNLGLGMLALAIIVTGALLHVTTNLQAASGGAQDDSFVFTTGQPVTINVLANDTLPTNNVRIYQLNDQHVVPGQTISITGGALTLNSDNTVTFTPDPGFTGAPSFTYALESLQTSQLETFDLPGQTTGPGSLPVLATAYPQRSDDWGVESDTGVNGSNSFFSGWTNSGNNVTGVSGDPLALTLPEPIDLTVLGEGDEINISMDARVQSTGLGCPTQAGCNEAWLALVDPNQLGNGFLEPYDVINTPHTILLGLQWNNASNNSALALESLTDGGQAICGQTDGTYTVIAPPSDVAGVERCMFAVSNPVQSFAPITGQYFHLILNLRVEGGDLIANITADDNLILGIANIDLGAVSLRPWWNNMLPAYLTDDHADNLSFQSYIHVDANATVTGTWIPNPDSPDTGF